jgi:hypothetical protein
MLRGAKVEAPKNLAEVQAEQQMQDRLEKERATAKHHPSYAGGSAFAADSAGAGADAYPEDHESWETAADAMDAAAAARSQHYHQAMPSAAAAAEPAHAEVEQYSEGVEDVPPPANPLQAVVGALLHDSNRALHVQAVCNLISRVSSEFV